MVSPVNLNQFGYESIREIGRGRFGSVLLVRSTSEIHHMSVCKIIMLESLCEGDKRLAEQEVNLLQSLIHRSIVRFEDVIRIAPGSSLGLVMEYCDGGDLRHAILEQATRGSYFPENEVMTWFTQILEGVRFIHANRIIHRDLKTSNIFLKGPPPYRCLIGDFGISRVLEETLSSAHTVIGTPYYISPEVCKREPYTVKSDVWSLGCVLYEMCMLRMAFKSSNLLSLVSRIIHDPYDPIETQCFSPEISNLIDRLLTKDPNLRPSSSEILHDPFVFPFTNDQTVDPPVLLVPVNIRRRPTLRSRAGARRIPPLIPLDSEEPSISDPALSYPTDSPEPVAVSATSISEPPSLFPGAPVQSPPKPPSFSAPPTRF